jgi:hypothetical protein
MPQTTHTVELVDNELRAFLAEIAQLDRGAGSLRISAGPDGMRMQVDGRDWTPAFGHVDTAQA